MPNSKSSLSVSQLNVYPVKSCAGTALETAKIDGRGIELDRAWMVVDGHGKFLTQRQLPRMALIKPELDDGNGLTLTAPGMESLNISADDSGEVKEVYVWSDLCTGQDQGNAVADWLSGFLGRPCRLVRMSDNFQRKVHDKFARSDSDQLGFADGLPFLLISEESLADLNERLDSPVPMDRFRPNIVVKGCKPFAEDGWSEFRIGNVVFDAVKLCARCSITTVNQQNAEVKAEPLKTLAGYRMREEGVMFGQNLIHRGQGRISVGDSVELIS